MRRLLALVLAAGAAAATTAGPVGASDTYHGKFVSASGYSSQFGAQTLVGTGDWNVNIGANGTQITGGVFVTHAPCSDSLPPCQFNLSLSLVDWSNAHWTNGVFSADGAFAAGGGAVVFEFALTLDPNAGNPLRIDVTITGCPYGWQSWHLIGAT